MLINKTGFPGYYKPGIKKNKKVTQGVETDSAIEFEKDKHSKDKKEMSKHKQNDSDTEFENEEFKREDNEFINIFV